MIIDYICFDNTSCSEFNAILKQTEKPKHKMKRKPKYSFCFLLLFLFILKTVVGQDKIGEIRIDESERNITNLSGALNDSISFHLIINKSKGKRNFKSSLVFFGFSGKSKTIFLDESENKPVYLAFHTTDKILTLTKLKEESVLIQDVDYNNGSINSTELSGTPLNLFSHQNITFLNFSRSLDLAFIKSSKDLQRNKAHFSPGFDRTKFVNPDFDKIDFIDNTKFVYKGSIKQSKAFYNNDNLVILNDYKDKGLINILYVSPDGILSSDIVKITKKGKIKKLSSYIKDDLLFSFYMLKNAAYLNIYDLHDLSIKKEFKYDIKDFGMFNELVINGKKRSKENLNPKRFLHSFFPQAVGSTYNPELYLSVNKTVKNGFVIEVGHVDKNTYNNPNRNYWWDNPLFSDQFKISTSKNTSANLSAAAGMAQIAIFNALDENKRKGNYFELYLDTNLNPIEEEVDYQYEIFEKEDYISKYEGKFKLKKNYFIPTGDKVRLINFDKDYYIIYRLDKIR
jgi:hypothetical protein